MDGSGKISIALKVNGGSHEVMVAPRKLLSDVLREDLRLTGTHVGCEHGICGACTILVDGLPVRSCLMLAVQVEGCDVQTIEGLARADGSFNELQSAFNHRFAAQCGYCTPGILMTLQHLKNQNRDFSEEEIRNALGGHICRCTGYREIIDAAMDVVGAGSCQTED